MSARATFYVRKKSGTARSGAARDAGTVTHAVADDAYPSWLPALCGVSPGAAGGGWQEPEPGFMVSCPMCRAKLADNGGPHE